MNRPSAERAEDVEQAHHQEQPEAAAQRHFEPEHRDGRHQQHVDQRDDAVRQQLADDQLPASERRHVQLLERAQLLLTHDGHRGQVGGDEQEQQGQHAGDHEEPALELRVEPDANPGVDASGAGASRSSERPALRATSSCAYSPTSAVA